MIMLPTPLPISLARAVCFGICWCAMGMSATAAGGDSERPNLVFIKTDDQGRWAMGAYGNRQIQTPHMDRIAREGALFSDAIVVTPVCSPSRGTTLTGLYPTQIGITDWIHPAEAAAGLGLAAPTWPEQLQAAGYRTALIGKWHLGEQTQFHPTRRGFDHFMGFLAGGNKPMDPVLEVEGQERQLVGPLPDLLVDDCLKFIEANRARPFAVCLHFRAPHLPYGPVPEMDSAPYEDLEVEIPHPPGGNLEQIRRQTRNYYASISSIDRNVGRLLERLDAWGLAQHTLVIFTSDHGYNEGRHGVDTKGNAQWIAGGVRGPKRPNMWETSITVPLAMRWPAVIAPGMVIDRPVTNLDFYRTVLGALDVELPADCAAQGIDFSPLLRGQELPRREALFGQYDLHNGGLAYLRMIRTDRYKYVRHYRARMMDELYDLRDDPDEARNLIQGGNADRWSAVVDSLQAQLAAWQESIDAPVSDSPY